MRISTRRRSTLSTAFAVLVILSLAAPAWAADPPTLAPSGAQPTLDGRVTGSKSATSRLAETDANCLARKDAAMVNVVIKLDYDAVAVYGRHRRPRSHEPAGHRQGHRQRLRGSQGVRQVRRVPPGRLLVGPPQGGPVREARDPARTVYGGVAARIPANASREGARRSRASSRCRTTARAAAHRLEPVVHRRRPRLHGARRHGQRRQGGHLRRPRHRRLAGAPVVRRPGQPARPAGEGRRHAAGLQLRRQPADPGGRPVRLQQASSSAASRSSHYLSTRSRGGRAVPDTRPRLQRPRHPHRHAPPPATSSRRRRSSASTAARSTASPRRLGLGLQGLRHRGLLRLRLGRGRRAGHPRRRPGHQLLDLRRHRPVTDPVELAFLDAYAAGVFVAASAGNAGPGASTADHLSPWVTTVAASTQTRSSRSTLTLTGGGATATFTGASITAGVGTPLPVVLVVGPAVQQRAVQRARPAGHLRRARSSPASAAATAASRRASTSSRAAPPG